MSVSVPVIKADGQITLSGLLTNVGPLRGPNSLPVSRAEPRPGQFPVHVVKGVVFFPLHLGLIKAVGTIKAYSK